MIRFQGDAGPIPLPAPETYTRDLNEVMQTIATVGLWAGTIALLIYAARIGRQERSPLPVFIVLAVAAGSIFEPIYDITYHLHWLGADPEGNGPQWTLFTSFGLPQPVWVMPAYVVVFALPAVLLYRTFAGGVTLKKIYQYAALTAFTTALFETIAVNSGLYTYYGEAPMRFLNYPLFIAFMECAQITGFAVLCAVIKLRATKWQHNLIVFLVFPANFAFECLGAGFPTLVAMNAPNPSTAVMWAMAPVSIGLAAAGLYWTSQALFAVQRLAELEGRAPSLSPTSRIEQIAAPVV
ncbi:hypothetical protein [Sporichthya polymorpha]|uniref:hypothetical protein n=1 Tax=Sporichthya polymorpha TaxID=35751 RepID=UPI000373F157|nr:hypothetical protein [Sporichthya polymorpha]